MITKIVKRALSGMIVAAMTISLLPTMSVMAATDYDTLKDDDTMLAYYMDKPLYEAIAEQHSAQLDSDNDGINLSDAIAFTGSITVSNRPTKITGTLRGIEKFASAASLDVSRNELSGEVPDLTDNTKLKTLNFNGNQLTGDVGDLKIGSTVLELLYLHNNRLTGDVSTIKLDHLVGLKQVFFAGNRLTGVLGDLDVSANVLLENFEMNNNRLVGGIPDFSANTKLKYLLVYENCLTGDITNLDLSQNTELVSIRFDNNKLIGEVPDLTANDKLTSIYLHNNNLTGSIMDLALNSKLTILHLNGNNLVGEIPSFSNLTALETLELGDNGFSGTLPSFTANTKLKAINLSNNRFTGTFPDFSKSTALRYLYLDGNKFTGEIPDLSMLADLQFVQLNSNDFTGEIPSFVTNTKLETLKLEGNKNLGGTLVPANLVNFATIHGTKIDATAQIENITSSLYKYSTSGAFDGTAMILNQVVNDKITLNITGTANSNSHVTSNIDVNGDGKADLNIDFDFDGRVDFNQASRVLDSSRLPIGWIPTTLKINTVLYPTISADMFDLGSAPYYLVAKSSYPDLIIPNTKTVLLPDTDPNESSSYIDVPMGIGVVNTIEHDNNKNIDLDGDGIPDLNVVGNREYDKEKAQTGETDGHGFPIVDFTNNEEPRNPIQSTDPNGANYSPTGKVEDLYNITLIEGEEPTINVLPPNTTVEDFDEDGNYIGGSSDSDRQIGLPVDGDGWSYIIKNEEGALEVTINVTATDQVRKLLNTVIVAVGGDATLDDIVKLTIIGATPMSPSDGVAVRELTNLNEIHLNVTLVPSSFLSGKALESVTFEDVATLQADIFTNSTIGTLTVSKKFPDLRGGVFTGATAVDTIVLKDIATVPATSASFIKNAPSIENVEFENVDLIYIGALVGVNAENVTFTNVATLREDILKNANIGTLTISNRYPSISGNTLREATIDTVLVKGITTVPATNANFIKNATSIGTVEFENVETIYIGALSGTTVENVTFTNVTTLHADVFTNANIGTLTISNKYPDVRGGALAEATIDTVVLKDIDTIPKVNNGVLGGAASITNVELENIDVVMADSFSDVAIENLKITAVRLFQANAFSNNFLDASEYAPKYLHTAFVNQTPKAHSISINESTSTQTAPARFTAPTDRKSVV